MFVDLYDFELDSSWSLKKLLHVPIPSFMLDSERLDTSLLARLLEAERAELLLS